MGKKHFHLQALSVSTKRKNKKPLKIVHLDEIPTSSPCNPLQKIHNYVSVLYETFIICKNWTIAAVTHSEILWFLTSDLLKTIWNISDFSRWQDFKLNAQGQTFYLQLDTLQMFSWKGNNHKDPEALTQQGKPEF